MADITKSREGGISERIKWFCCESLMRPKFNEFKPRLKYEMWFKRGWFHPKLYQMFRDLGRRLIGTEMLADQRRGLNYLNSASGLLKSL